MTWQSPLLLPEEAASYLRLDVERDMPAALRALTRLVESRQLRPCLVGKCRRFLRDELDRFLRDATERYGASHQ